MVFVAVLSLPGAQARASPPAMTSVSSPSRPRTIAEFYPRAAISREDVRGGRGPMPCDYSRGQGRPLFSFDIAVTIARPSAVADAGVGETCDVARTNGSSQMMGSVVSRLSWLKGWETVRLGGVSQCIFKTRREPYRPNKSSEVIPSWTRLASAAGVMRSLAEATPNA